MMVQWKERENDLYIVSYNAVELLGCMTMIVRAAKRPFSGKKKGSESHKEHVWSSWCWALT